jgi:hypothetical protein
VTTAKAEENLALQSQAFGTSPWGVANGSVTSDATTAPDGTSTADLLYPSGASVVTSTTQGGIAITSNTTTFSVYGKTNGINNIWFISGNNNSAAVWFNVSAGTVGTTAGGYTASIVSVGSGWYRCIVTGSFSNLQIGISASDGSYTSSASGTNGVYLWGCQAEIRSSATAYTATTTQAITNYIPKLLTAGANQPRFDHNPTTGESLGLLIEEQRTNSCTDSVSLLGTGGSTITANATVAPDGSTTCRLINVPSGYAYTGSMSGIVGGNTTWTYSVYIKNYSQFGSATQVILGLAGTYNTLRVTVSNLTGVPTVALSDATNATLVSSSVTSVGNNWYRISVTGTYTGTVGYNEFQFITPSSIVSLFVWGMQLEAGYFATSYIPTTSASVTRTADAASMTGTNFSSWFNNAQGTLYAEQYITNVTAGSVNNQTAACLYKDSSNFIATGQGVGDAGGTGQRSSIWVIHNNTTQVYASTGNFITVGLTLKNAVAYETNNFAYSANTQTLITDTSGTVPAVNSLSIGFYLIGINYYANNPIRKIAFYPVRVTNAQLQALTS